MYTLKKSLGQHFLKDENICKKIVHDLQQEPFDQLLEVGPGAGALTKYLLQIPKINFKAVELDDEKVDFLLQSFPEIKDKIIAQDFLEMEKPFTGKFTVIGNFPYNISSQIVFKILDWKEEVQCMIGMFQKEVAQRIVAKSGNKVYGVISVLVQIYFDTTYLFEVSETCFNPPPKVKSAVIKIVPRKNKIEIKSDKALKQIVKAAFNQRRKMLRNAVKDLFLAEDLKTDIFNKRAEQLSIYDFAQLTFLMADNKTKVE